MLQQTIWRAGPSKMCMKRKELTIHTQGASHLLHDKPAGFAQRAPHLLQNKPTSFTKPGCCSAPGAPALSPGPSHSPGGSCRAARPAGRHRELKGERTGMYRGYMENVWRMHGKCTENGECVEICTDGVISATNRWILHRTALIQGSERRSAAPWWKLMTLQMLFTPFFANTV